MNNSYKDFMHKNYNLKSKNHEFNKALSFCERVAGTEANILLIGESGSGKDIAAQYIHACGKRNKNNFVAVNCSAYTESLLESELFGHEQGSFTGASKTREGKFEVANQGTLFLDEIGDLSLHIQLKLLRVIESKRIERIGSNNMIDIDFQLITATNSNLHDKIINQKFREDFFYRISTIVIRIPPLRSRKEDLPDLIQYFLDKSQKNNNINITHIKPAVSEFLYNYHYPGNIRELKNIIERMVILSSNGVIDEDTLPILFNMDSVPPKTNSTGDYDDTLTWKDFKSQSEKEFLICILNKYNWNITNAAKHLNISTRQIFNKIKEYNIKQ